MIIRGSCERIWSNLSIKYWKIWQSYFLLFFIAAGQDTKYCSHVIIGTAFEAETLTFVRKNWFSFVDFQLWVGSWQCDQIGWFLKVLGNKFAYKSNPKRLLTFGLFCKRSINVKTALHILYATFLIQHMVTLD